MKRALVALALLPALAQAMELRIAGNELHLRGQVLGYEFGYLRDVLAGHPEIDTVVFRDSPGGDGWTAFRIGEKIRDAGLRTVVAGRCYSACTLMFLGGKSRHFARASRPELVYLAFHGAFIENVFDPNEPSTYGRSQVRAWIVERTEGKIDLELLDRFLRGERRAALLYAFDALQFKLDYGFSLYYCDGTEPGGAPPYRECEKLAGRDAFSLGFVNAEERVRVRPSSALPPPYRPDKH
ncbi:MAG: hypothetical protein ABR570_03850 [Burkholderiales bacterium]